MNTPFFFRAFFLRPHEENYLPPGRFQLPQSKVNHNTFSAQLKSVKGDGPHSHQLQLTGELSSSARLPRALCPHPRQPPGIFQLIQSKSKLQDLLHSSLVGMSDTHTHMEFVQTFFFLDFPGDAMTTCKSSMSATPL